MRWRWRRPESVEPDHGRDSSGRLHDGDRVRPDGWGGWADLLPSYPADAGREALTEPTQILARPLTRGQRLRGEGGGWHR